MNKVRFVFYVSFFLMVTSFSIIYAQFPCTFTNIAHINDGGLARDVAVGADGTIFLANHDAGLRAYNYDGSSFVRIAHMNNGGYAKDVKVGADGTVFLACDNDGLRAYFYSGYVEIKKVKPILPDVHYLKQNHPNPFNGNTRIQYGLPEQSDVKLNIFDTTGRKIKQWNISNQ